MVPTLPLEIAGADFMFSPLDETAIYARLVAGWSRVLFGQKDQYIHVFDNSYSSQGRMRLPGGIDISAQRTVYVADRINGRVVLGSFSNPNGVIYGIGNTPSTLQTTLINTTSSSARCMKV